MTMLRPRYRSLFQGCEERSDSSIVDSFPRASGDLPTYPTERSESFDSSMMHSSSFNNNMPANSSERHAMEETSLMSVLEQVHELSLENNCNERPRAMLRTPSQHSEDGGALPAFPSEHHARLEYAAGMGLQRPSLIVHKTRSNSFLVHNAPRIPESPDLTDGQAVMTENHHHHHRYLPPQFSPAHNQVLVQYPQHVRDALQQQQQHQRTLNTPCEEQDHENMMEEAFCDEQSVSCPPPPPLPTFGTPEQSCAADNRISSSESAALWSGALKMRRVNARALVFS